MTLRVDGLELDQLTADPGSPVNGQVWYNDTTKKFSVQQNGVTTTLVSATDLPPAQVLEVAQSGRPYTSVAAAIAAITDATSTKQYIVQVHPGVYTESPFTMKAYVHVHGTGGWYDTVLKTNDNTNHFITGTAGSEISSLAIEGPTGSGYACIDYTGTGTTPFFVRDVVIRKGYYGVYVHPASYGTLHAHDVVNQYAGSQINQFFRVTNGNLTSMLCSFMSGPSAAVVTGWYLAGASTTATLDQCSFGNAGSTDAVYVDDGAVVRLNGTTLSAGGYGIHIGATVTTTASAVYFNASYVSPNFTKCVKIDTSNSDFIGYGSASGAKLDIATGARTSGLMVESDPAQTGGTTVFGSLFTGPNLLDISTWLDHNDSAGLATGGGCRVVSGLQVKGLAGTGYAHDGSGNLKHLSWADSTITLSASQNIVYIYVDNTGTVTSGTASPDLTTNILLGVANTNGTNVRFLTNIPVVLPDTQSRLWDYTSEVIGPISVSGGAVTKHASPSLQVDVSSGNYYIHNVDVTFGSASIASWTYWYRDGSGKWTTTTGNTSLDVTYYDNGSGTLQAMTAGYWKRDLLFVSVEDGTTKWHVVYGQAEYSTSGGANVIPSAPDVLLNNSCRLASFTVQKSTTDITTITDERPRVGQLVSASAGVTAHSALTGLTTGDDHCFSADTELLTTNGWVNYQQVEKHQTMAMSFNRETERLEPSMVLGKYVYDSFKELVRFRAQGTEILVTPEHKMVYRNAGDTGTWQETTANELARFSEKASIPLSGVGHDVDYPRPDEYLKLLAWIVSEGNAINPKKGGYGYRIYQAEGEKADRINKILTDLGVHNGHVGTQDNRGRKVGDSEYTTNVVMKVFYVPSWYAKNSVRIDLDASKVPQRHMFGMSSRQFRMFLGELVLGDGSIRNNDGTANAASKVQKIDEWVSTGDLTFGMAYASKNEALIDWLQEGCALNGLRSKKFKTKKGLWTLNVTASRTQENLKSDTVPYDGDVWCVSVMKNKTLVLRRNGRVFIAGNTQYQLRSEKGSASGYVGLNGSTKIDNTYLQTATSAPGTVAVSAAAVGSGPKLAFEDHNHSLSVGSPVAIGTANSDGTATSAARSDHVHSHGNQTSGTLHAAATQSVAGFLSTTDKAKLDNITASILQWGNNAITTTTTTRYLTPCWSDGTAPTTAIQIRVPVAGTIRNLYVRQNTVGTGTNTTVYAVRVNGSTSGVTCSIAANANNGQDTTHTVAVVAGDLVDIIVTKALALAAAPTLITASVEVQQ